MFEKTLTDVVKGIRASKRDTALYISQCIAEIKNEINSSDMYVKANALQKLTFLQMMGYSMNWASFATIEVMSSPRFAHKRIGYLGASQGFTPDTEVILLTTNLLKKELRGAVGGGMHGVYEAGLAINCVSNIVTEDLGRDLLPELTNLLTHPQPYLRKKAILCLFKVFVKYPQGLRLTFAKLQQCLSDQNPAVVSCAVNVITELSDKNPKNYLPLAPAFFDLLTNSNNNWMLIKVVKLLGSLVPEEPRLARKLLEPLASIVKKTQAKSLLYEAVYTITLCLPYCRKSDGSMPAVVPEIVDLCAKTLRSLVEEADQNLKYLGLVGFGSLMQSHPRVLSSPDYRPLILACLSDPDVTIRTRALDLLPGMISRKNLMELVTQLLKHVERATGPYKHDLVETIIELCSADKYSYLQDFQWYLDILFLLGHMRGIEKHAILLRAQITDVALRVLPLRTYAVRRSIEILLEGEGGSSDDPHGDNGRGKNIMPEILPALAWIIGEYSDTIPQALGNMEKEGEEFFFDDDSKGSYHAIVQALTSPSHTKKLPTRTQAVYVQAAMKLFAAAAAIPDVKSEQLEACLNSLQTNLPVYMQSTDVEVVERSFTSIELLKTLDLSSGAFDSMPGLTTAQSMDDESDEEAADDLLGMSESKGKTPKIAGHSDTNKSLASKIRDASVTLNYILKQSPMKPTGAKAQRKKRQSPIGVSANLDDPVDLSIFHELLQEEQLRTAGSKLTLEAVSFTQQTPMQVEERQPIGMLPAVEMTGFGSSAPSTEASSSFQKSFAASTAVPVQRQREGDPFYLNSATASGGEESADNANLFGTIQLSEEGDGPAAMGSKKPKKIKKEKKPRANPTSAALFGEGYEANEDGITMYHSDDEDVDDERPSVRGSKKSKDSEFAGLSKVDLLTPLRDDEVMPERKHRVVEARPKHAPEVTKEAKKPKKPKKKSKERESGTAVADLLDLSVFETTTEASSSNFLSAASPAAPTMSFGASTNPISNAFDDIFGLGAVQTPVLQTSAPSTSGTNEVQPASQSFPQDSKHHSRPWLIASLKGLPPALANCSLQYRVYRSGGKSASVSFRFNNNGSTNVSGISLELKNGANLSLGDVQSSSFSESSKVGPFNYSIPDSGEDIKGILRIGSSAITVKVSLPAALHLNPDENVTLEHLTSELASSGWTSQSGKANIRTTVSPDVLKEILCSFFRASEVSGSSANPAVFTLAARSSSGAPARFLVKIKGSTVRVDITSTNAALAKALASDMKRLAL